MCLKKRIFILSIAFLVLFVSIIEPVKSQAAAVPLIQSLGSAAAVKGFIEFFTVMVAGGMAVNNVEDIQEAFKLYAVPDPPPNPDRPPEYDPDMTTLAHILLGSATANLVYQNLGDFRNWLIGVFGGLIEGVNSVEGGTKYSISGINVSVNNLTVGTSNKIESYVNGVLVGTSTQNASSYPPSVWQTAHIDKVTKTVSETRLYVYAIRVDGQRSNFSYVINSYFTDLSTGTYYPISEQTIDNSINLIPNAPLVAVEFDPAPPLPPYRLPSLLSINSESPNIETRTNSSGVEQIIYNGSIEEYANEFAENVTMEDLLQTNQPGINPVPSTDVYGNSILVLQPETGLNPYPDINTDPILDPAAFQGANIGLLQSIVNWLANIFNAIANIPAMLISLIVPEIGYWGTKLGELETILTTKFDSSGSINFLNGLNAIYGKPIPDLYYQDQIVLKASYVNGVADNVRSWLRFIMYVYIVIMSMNNSYKLIRGGTLFDGKGYSSGSGGSGGGSGGSGGVANVN